MISIRNSLSELERSLRLRDEVVECYVAAIQDAGQYAVELDDSLTRPHREALQRLARGIARAGIAESRGALRALLRDYHDKAGEYISKLRGELAASAAALQDTVRSLCQSDGDHEERMRGAVARLRAISGLPEASGVAPTLRTAVEAVEQGLDEAKKHQQLAISQFLTEIRLLHQRVEALEIAASIDSSTHLLRRSRIEERIRETPRTGRSLLAIQAKGLKSATAAADDLAGAFARRLRNCLPSSTPIGRWGEEEFVAILQVGRLEALDVADQLARRLSGVYTCVRDGNAVRSNVEIRLAVVPAEGENAEGLLDKVRTFFESG